MTGTCRSLIGLFLLQQGARRVPGVEGPVQPREVPTPAVVGAGTLGGGIAHALARAGIQARLKDINAEALGRGMAAAAAIFRRDLRRGRLQPREFDQKMALIRPTLDDTGLKRATVIIDAVVESLPVKRQVLEGDYYPLTPYSLALDRWIAWQFNRPEQGDGVVQAFRRAESVYEAAIQANERRSARARHR